MRLMKLFLTLAKCAFAIFLAVAVAVYLVYAVAAGKALLSWGEVWRVLGIAAVPAVLLSITAWLLVTRDGRPRQPRRPGRATFAR